MVVPSIVVVNAKLKSRPFTVPLTCCSPNTCDEYDPDRESPCCLSVTVGVPVPASVVTVKRQVPVRFGGVPCACAAPERRTSAARAVNATFDGHMVPSVPAVVNTFVSGRAGHYATERG